MPARRFDSSGRAANPTTMPAAPAEANRLTPYWRTAGNVIIAALTVTSPMRTVHTRRRRRTCVTCLRVSASA